MNSKTMNIVLMVIIALILVVTVVIAVMTFSNHTPQPLPMHNEENVEANVTVENTIKNEIVEQPENLPTLKNKGEIAKVRSVYTDENFKTVTVPAGYAIIKDSPNTNDGMVISNVADDDLDNSKEGNQFVWFPFIIFFTVCYEINFSCSIFINRFKSVKNSFVISISKF